MQGHGQVNVPNIIIDCNPCSSAKKTRWCQTAATADKNRQEYSRQDSRVRGQVIEPSVSNI